MDGIKRPLYVPQAETSVEPSLAEAVHVDEAIPDTFALLERTTGPQEAAWEAEHRLSPTARRKHLMLAAFLGGLGLVVALWQGSIVSLIVVVLALVAWELRERFAKPVRVHINNQGIWVDSIYHPHAELATFDMHFMPDGVHEVSIRSAAWHTPDIRLPVGDQDPEAVHSVLLQYLPEDRHAIPPLEWWMRK